MSVAEYLEYEHSQDIRRELVDGYLHAMTGANELHERISANLLAALVVHLGASPCRAYKGDPEIAVGEDHHYPDVLAELYARGDRRRCVVRFGVDATVRRGVVVSGRRVRAARRPARRRCRSRAA